MDSSAGMMWSVLFGALGMGYLVYGKKQRHTLSLIAGVGLCVFPYFISNVILVVLVGIVLIALPFLIR